MSNRRFYLGLGTVLVALILQGGSPTHVRAVGNAITAVDFGGRFDLIATSTGDIYLGDHPSAPDGSDIHWTHQGNFGSGSPVVQIQYLYSDAGHEYVWAYTEDGSLYVSEDFGRTWTPRGNVFSGGTPTRFESWGHIKARYR